MDGNLFFSMNLDANDAAGLTRGVDHIVIQRATGETLRLAEPPVQIVDEHPDVDRMEGDWGAICEVFRKSSYYYVSIAGMSLAAGDVITIYYRNRPVIATLRVTEIENGRARTAAPVVSPAPG